MQPIRKFQVFVSATYTDLLEERQQVFHAIMTARQIPVGMELFTAADDRGWGVIKRVIDTSDYYVVVLAGRYGSIDPMTGISWTEREYQYAVSKGVKVLPFIRSDNDIKVAQMDTDPDKLHKQEMLAKFKATLKNTHLTPDWTTKEDLASKVAQALRNQIQDDEADGTLPPGWVRGGDTLATLGELARLSEENRKLREQVASMQVTSAPRVVLELLAYPAEGTQVQVKKPFHRVGEVSPFYGLHETGAYVENLEEYVGELNRSALVALYISNVGTAPATNVEVEINFTNVAAVKLSMRMPTFYAAAAIFDSEERSDSTRNVVLENDDCYEDGTAIVTQRVKMINAKTVAKLIPFYIIVRGDVNELSFRADVTANDATGQRVDKSFDFTIIHEGETMVEPSAY